MMSQITTKRLRMSPTRMKSEGTTNYYPIMRCGKIFRGMLEKSTVHHKRKLEKILWDNVEEKRTKQNLNFLRQKIE